MMKDIFHVSRCARYLKNLLQEAHGAKRESEIMTGKRKWEDRSN